MQNDQLRIESATISAVLGEKIAKLLLNEPLTSIEVNLITRIVNILNQPINSRKNSDLTKVDKLKTLLQQVTCVLAPRPSSCLLLQLVVLCFLKKLCNNKGIFSNYNLNSSILKLLIIIGSDLKTPVLRRFRKQMYLELITSLLCSAKQCKFITTFCIHCLYLNGPKQSLLSSNKKMVKTSYPKLASRIVDFDKQLWKLAASFSINESTHQTESEIANKALHFTKISDPMNALITGFERLNHIASHLFNSRVIIFGSAANGCITKDSDIDMSLMLNDSNVNDAINDIQSKMKHLPDVFPYRSFKRKRGSTLIPSRTYTAWDWVNQNDREKTAKGWTLRKFAWAIERIYCWNTTLVPSKNISIVKVSASLSSENGYPIPCSERYLFDKDSLFIFLASCNRVFPVKKEIGYTAHSLRLTAITSYLLDANCYKRCSTLDTLLELLANNFYAMPSKQKKYSKDIFVNNFKNYLSFKCLELLVCEELYASWPITASLLNTEYYISARNSLKAEEEITPPALSFFYLVYKGYFEYLFEQLVKVNSSRFIIPINIENPTLQYPKLSVGLFDKWLFNPKVFSVKNLLKVPPSFHWKVFDAEFDVTSGSCIGAYNTRLVRSYVRVDMRAQALIILIKQFCKKNQINNAYTGFLSSYHWTVLVLHFLQHYFCLEFSTECFAKFKNKSKQKSNSSDYLPILPNLCERNTISKHIKNCIVPLYDHQSFISSTLKSDSTKIQDYFFYSYTNGINEPLSVGNYHWQESSKERFNPIEYAYNIITPFYKLQNESYSDILRNINQGPAIGKDCQVCGESASETIFLMRLNSYLLLNSEQKISTTDWKRKEAILIQKMEKDPELNLPVTHFSIPQSSDGYFHNVFKRSDSIFEWDKVTRNVTLAELFISFFEYYLSIFDSYSDIADINFSEKGILTKCEVFNTRPFNLLKNNSKSQDENCGLSLTLDLNNYCNRRCLTLRDPLERNRTIGVEIFSHTIILATFIKLFSRLKQVLLADRHGNSSYETVLQNFLNESFNIVDESDTNKNNNPNVLNYIKRHEANLKGLFSYPHN